MQCGGLRSHNRPIHIGGFLAQLEMMKWPPIRHEARSQGKLPQARIHHFPVCAFAQAAVLPGAARASPELPESFTGDHMRSCRSCAPFRRGRREVPAHQDEAEAAGQESPRAVCILLVLLRLWARLAQSDKPELVLSKR